MRWHSGCGPAIAAVFAILGSVTTMAAPTAGAPSFGRQVQRIFYRHCTECHSPGHVGYQAISLDLTTYRGVMAGSTLGPAVIPRQPQLSPIMLVLDWKARSSLKMPPLGHELTEKDRDVIRAWIAAGAKND